MRIQPEVHEEKENIPVGSGTKAAGRKKLLRLILAVCVSAAVVFAGVSLFWYGFRYLPYKNAAGRMQPDSDQEIPRYTAVSGDYLFRIKLPKFLSFESGFLYVGPADELAAFIVNDDGSVTEKNVPHVDMFIWPKIFSEAGYGVTLYEESSSEQILVDGRGEFLSGVDSMSGSDEAALRELYGKHREEILDVISAAKDFWGDDLP